jgi:hypothetical protein
MSLLWRGVALTRLKSRLNAVARSIVRIQICHECIDAVKTFPLPCV